MILRVFEVVFGEGRRELRREFFRVQVPDTECDERSDISEHGVSYILRKLMRILMSENEVKPILSRFRQY